MYELVLQFLTQIFGLMYSVLTEDLSDFSPHAYEYISILNTILKGFASSLMLVAFCVGYIQSAVSLIEQKTPIAIFKTLARLVIVNALVVRGTDIILMPMFSVVRSLTSRLIEAMGGQAGLLPNIDESSPGGIAGAIGELLSINILTGILYIAVIISGLVLLLTVFGRFTDSNLNHTGIYLYSKGKIMIHLTFDYQSDEGCTTPGQYLRYHRTFQGLTTRELAEKVGVVPATLVLYENDRHPIKHSTAVALANVLGIDRSRLLDEYTVFVDYPYSSLLKKVRRELSFTQMQMAEVIGIGQTTYSGWEREVRVPRRKEHEKILAAMKKLKVDVDTYLCQPNPL